MAMTDVQICNLALARLGSSLRITALTDGSVQADQCALFFENLRDMTLEDFPWSFASRHGALTVDATARHPFYEYAYNQPSGCLTIRRIYTGDADDTVVPPSPALPTIKADYVRFNYYAAGTPVVNKLMIASDLEDAWIEYTIQITDPTFFSMGFVDALAWKLTVSLAPSIKGDVGFKNIPLLEAEYQGSLSRAEVHDANQGIEPLAQSTRYKDSRW